MKRKKIYKTRKKTAININKEIIKKYKKSNLLNTIALTCQKCRIEIIMNTTRPEIYTNEVIKNWVCINCRIMKK